MSEDEQQVPTIICPTCGNTISPDLTLWVRLGKWYCSEQCVRDSMKRN